VSPSLPVSELPEPPTPANTALPSWNDSPPYPGLRAFRFEEAAIFCGRDGETDDLVARLRDCQFLTVIGASGTGRSSLVNAGLLPRLAEGAIERSWRVVNVRLRSQGDNPFLALANALLQRAQQDDPPMQPLYTRDPIDLAKSLENDPKSITEFAKQILPNPKETPSAELVIFIDQFEELFTIAKNYQERFVNLH
jgi:conflict system STAND superfamily ATPase